MKAKVSSLGMLVHIDLALQVKSSAPGGSWSLLIISLEGKRVFEVWLLCWCHWLERWSTHFPRSCVMLLTSEQTGTDGHLSSFLPLCTCRWHKISRMVMFVVSYVMDDELTVYTIILSICWWIFFSQVKIVEYIVVALRRASSGVSQEYLVVLVRWVRQ